MLINYLINSPNARVQQLDKEVVMRSEPAGAVVESAKGDANTIKKYTWLLKLLA